MASAYPAHRETDVLLRDGSTVHLRPARPEDAERVEDYLIGLSPESRHLRFWGASIDVREIAAKATACDYVDHLTLLALVGGDDGRVVGGAQYLRADTARAEVSVSVADELQGRGLGSILVAHLTQAAHDAGIGWCYAEVLPENHRMIEVFRGTGFELQIHALPGNVRVEFPTDVTEGAVANYEDRRRHAATETIRTFLEPRSIAVIGASRDPDSIGGRLLRNLLEQPFAGVVHPVNPSANAVQGVPANPTILEVPGDVDLAFIAVPAASVLEVARQSAEKGVRSLVVISAGFAETGTVGAERQADLVALCRANGIRLLGPNCMGVVNTDPEVRLNGTFASAWPPAGNVGFLSQSGALGLAIMSQASALGLGLSSFVSIGNKADVSGNDLLSWWDQDERTSVILLYLESFGDPRRFARLARRIGRRKPIVVVKSGRSAAGLRGTASHTGALLAASDSTVNAMFRQTGVIRTDTLEEMFDVATLLANQPVPQGNRVAILTNAGGLGILCADTCEARGLAVPELAPETAQTLRSFLPAESSAANPVDMIASAGPEDYARAITTLANDPGIDALIVLYIPPLEAAAPAIAAAMVDAVAEIEREIPVLTCFMSARGLPEALRSGERGVRIPSYAYPEQAAIALAHAAAHGVWRARPEGVRPAFEVRDGEATAIIATALERGAGWLEPDEVTSLLDCYGLPTARAARAATAADAQEIARGFGGLVAVKAVGPVHKTDAGAVRLRVGADDVGAVTDEIAEAVRAAGEPLDGFLIQEMVPDGIETLVGCVVDSVFGSVIAVGAGGVTVELQRDVAVGVAPLTDLDADEMIRSLASWPLFEGFRGRPAGDVTALKDVILRVGELAERHHEIVEMDCNPVIVLEEGARIVDARIRIRVPEPDRPFASRVGN